MKRNFSFFPIALLLIAFLAGCGSAMRPRDGFISHAKHAVTPPVLAVVAQPSDTPTSNPTPKSAAPPISATPKVAPAKVGPVALRVAMSHANYSKDVPASLLFKVDYSAQSSVPLARPPLNIALVLDRSGSMSEDKKFPYTLEAARQVIENMTDRDTLSLVAFNHKVTVLSAAGRVVNKQFLLHRLEEISPEGETDLSAGLLEGLAQVSSKQAEGQIQQVLLLTDGLANRGVTDPAALQKIAEKAQAKGIGLSTFGCGTEFDEKLLSAMATAGSGRYTYIKSPEQIPTAFKDEVHGLLQAVAQNTSLEIAVTGGQIKKIYGEILEQPAASYKLNIGNLRSGEQGALVMELAPDKFEKGAAVIAEARMTFDDPQAGERTKRVAVDHSVFTAGQPEVASSENANVIIYGNILNALEQAEEAVRGLDTEKFRQVKGSFEQLYDRAHQYAVQSRDQQLLNQTFLLKHFMDELAAAEKEGLLHGHAEAREKLTKESHYQRYLLGHHRGEPDGR